MSCICKLPQFVRVSSIQNNDVTIEPVVDLKRLSFVTILVTDEDPEFSIKDIYNQAYSPLPPEENEFTLKGLNALGQRLETDITTDDERN